MGYILFIFISVRHFLVVDRQVVAGQEVIERQLAEGVVVGPETGDVVDIFLDGAVALGPGRVEVQDRCLAAAEFLHHEPVALLGDGGGAARDVAQLPLVVELADGREEADALVVLGLLHLGLQHFGGGLRLLHASLALTPVEDRDGEGQAHHLLVERVTVDGRKVLRRLGQTETGAQPHADAAVRLRLGDGRLGVEEVDGVGQVEGRILGSFLVHQVEVHQDGREVLVQDGRHLAGLVQAQQGVELHPGFAQEDVVLADREAVGEHPQLQLEVFVARDAPEREAFAGDAEHPARVLEVGAGDVIAPLRGHHAEVAVHGRQGHVFHRLQVHPFRLFVGLRGDELVPFELVVGEERLAVGDRHRLGIPGLPARAELVDAREVGIELDGTAREGDVLLDHQAQAVGHIEVGGIDQLAGAGLLQQAQGAVEVAQVAIDDDGGEAARLVGPPGPVVRYEGGARFQRRHGLRPRHADDLFERHRLRRPAHPRAQDRRH